MNQTIKKYMRSIQVLNLLKEHGPLTSRAISLLIKPAINSRQLKRLLARLQKNGFVIRRQGKVFAGRGSFYQINQDESVHGELSKILNCNPEALMQVGFRRREILHNDECALLSSSLKSVFPEAEIIREHDFKNHPLAGKVILESHNGLSIRPDLLLAFPKLEGADRVVIGFEIEKTAKSTKRIVRKLLKYTNKSHLAGIVYLCDSHHILSVVKSNYAQSVMAGASRIKQYGAHYLMFMPNVDKCFTGAQNVYNSDGNSISISNWITYLRNKPRVFRRDSEMKDMSTMGDLSLCFA